jgi:four helix bundle suffix protein
MPESSEQFLQKTGNYRALHAYRKAEVIYDFTFRFCENFLKTGDRTRDQMIQAARSGKQNIAEGSKASVTSTETEIKLMNVARASLEELLLDYQDFLRVRDLPKWDKNSREASYTRKLGSKPDESFETYRPFFADRPPAVLANVAVCLIHQANYLLDQLIRRLEKDFVEKGGLRERMTRARLNHRESQAQSITPRREIDSN